MTDAPTQPVAPPVSSQPKASAITQHIPLILMCITGFGFLGILVILAYHNIPEKGHDILVAMTGVLGTAFTGVTNYYFGSSSSSQKKDDTIKELSQ